jgi:protein involved in sex pheromone biosynthesis
MKKLITIASLVFFLPACDKAEEKEEEKAEEKTEEKAEAKTEEKAEVKAEEKAEEKAADTDGTVEVKVPADEKK